MSDQKQVVGQKEVSYGLQISLGGAGSRPGAKVSAPRKPPANVANLFSAADEPDEEQAQGPIDYRKRVALETKKSIDHRKIEKNRSEALEQDPTVFDYDSVYDEIKQQSGVGRIGGVQGPDPKTKAQPKYINTLLEKAAERQKQSDLIYEKKLQREVEAEKVMFGESEAFVTSSYKKQLQENRRWEEEQRKKDEEESKHDVRGKSDMTSFYTNLLTSNVAFSTADIKKQPSTTSGPKQKKEEPPIGATQALPRKGDPTKKPAEPSSTPPPANDDIEPRTQSAKRKLDEITPEGPPKANETAAAPAAAPKESVPQVSAEQKAEEERRKMAKRNEGATLDEAKRRYLERMAAKKSIQPTPT